MKGHGEKFSRRSEQFVATLLTESSIEAAAKKAGIGAVTAWRWMQDPAFADQYRQARRSSMRRVLSRLEQAAAAAVETLVWLQSQAEAESVRLGSSRTVLEMALRAAEMDGIEERLDKLKRIAKGGLKHHEQPDHAPAGAARGVNGHV
jgi:hypothetical protein